MAGKNSRIQKIDQTHMISRPFPHVCLTMIKVMGPDEIRLSQLICVNTETSDRLQEDIRDSLRGNINLLSSLL